MATFRSVPGAGALRRPALRAPDVLVVAGLLALLFGVVRIAPALNGRFAVASAPSTVSTDPSNLPYYAARSLLRMFIALGFSVAFSLAYATAAARLRRAEKVLLPVLDILQSVPILGFLSVTVTAFLALFPHSILGLESASIFAIFTSQAWNMTFAFYYALISQPRELDEAARVMRLTKWERFWKLDVPSGMIPLVWNGMMSFGGGWFFLAASEAISVNGHTYALPGIGAYVATAVEAGQLGRVGLAIVAMAVLVVGVNFVFWRPLVAWAERFRVEDSSAVDRPRSLVLNTLRRASVTRTLARPLRPVTRGLTTATRPFGLAEHPLHTSEVRRRAGDLVFAITIAAVVTYGAWRALSYVAHGPGLSSFGHAIGLGAITFARVVVIVVAATLVWVPVGVWIGMNPRISRLAQPVVQLLASFPANFLFPFAIALFVASGVSLDVGGIVLMSLGAQWYVLFNVIAGASAIPTDLREAMDSFGVGRVQRWKRLILPAIFPSYVTGGITAAGGAWNASIVAEIVAYNHHTLTAHGLGAYIAEATSAGDLPKVLVGVMVMSVYVGGLNRLFWRRLYRLSEIRYSLT